jgi:hypothetical protein
MARSGFGKFMAPSSWFMGAAGLFLRSVPSIFRTELSLVTWDDKVFVHLSRRDF